MLPGKQGWLGTNWLQVLLLGAGWSKISELTLNDRWTEG